jgi:hypothetical protein
MSDTLNEVVAEVSAEPVDTSPETDAGEVLAAVGVETPEEPEKADTKPEPKTDPEPKPEPDPEPKPAAQEDDPLREELFTEEALSSKEGIEAAKEGITKARGAAEELLRKNHATYLRLSKQEKRFKRTKDETLQIRQEAGALAQRNQADAVSLTQGSAEQVLETLGRMTGRDGLKMLESMNMAVASDGKHKPSSDVLELRKEIETLKTTIEQEREQASKQQTTTFIEARQNQLAKAAQNAELYPRLASIAADDPQNVGSFVADVIVEAFNNGQKISDAQALQLVEKQLQEKLGAPTPTAKAEPVRGNGAAAKPREAQSPPLGTQIEPAAATHEGAKRSLSDDELDSLTAEQLPEDFFESMGLPA